MRAEAQQSLRSIRKRYVMLPDDMEEFPDPEEDRGFFYVYPKIRGNRVQLADDVDNTSDLDD